MNPIILYKIHPVNSTILAGTPYEAGIFKVKLVLQRDFPASPPKGSSLTAYTTDTFHLAHGITTNYIICFKLLACLGFFTTKIFHPNVASNGEICVNTLKKDWKSDLGIKHILLVYSL